MPSDLEITCKKCGGDDFSISTAEEGITFACDGCGDFVVIPRKCSSGHERYLMPPGEVDAGTTGTVAQGVYAPLHEGMAEEKIRYGQRGTIYFVTGESEAGPVKIGFTHKDVGSRLRGLQTGNPERLRAIASVDGDVDFERALHRVFGHQRLSGEWFRRSVALLSLIDELTSQPASQG